MANPTAAMLVIGDEILSGRTHETNALHLARELTRVGIDLREVRIVLDIQDSIIDALNALRATYTHVFTSGGLGPTHDDITADCVAAAFGVGIGVRDDALELVEEARARWVDATADTDHLRMARIPDGATLIVYERSGAPGFSLGNVHVMAGVPRIFAAMLDVLLPALEVGSPWLAREVRLEVGEGRIAAALRQLAKELPEVSVGSYPFRDGEKIGTNVVVRATDPDLLDQAVVRVEAIRASLDDASA